MLYWLLRSNERFCFWACGLCGLCKCYAHLYSAVHSMLELAVQLPKKLSVLLKAPMLLPVSEGQQGDGEASTPIS